MSYNIEIRLAAKSGWHTPAEAKAYYGRYSREGFTVHWWGDPSLNPDSAHDNIVNYILSKATKGTGSVNYVLSNNKITMLVNPDNVAWASQGGNPTTVSCEFSPHLNAEGYKKAGWLINELEGRFGHVLSLYPHNKWFQTACPGTLDIGRMRAEANKWKSGGYNPQPVPQPTPVPTPPKPTTPIVEQWVRWKEGGIEYVCNKQPTHLWDFNSPSWDMKSVKQFNKGDRITIVGHAHNNKLNKDYYVTEYSFAKQITNGFNPADLDLYVAPPKPSQPTPTPPPDNTQVPPKPAPDPAPSTPTKDDEQDKRLTALESMIKKIVDFLKSIFTNFKD